MTIEKGISMMVFIIEIFLLILIEFYVNNACKGLSKIVLNIFNIMWLGGLACSNLGLYKMYTPSMFTNVIFLVSIITFDCIYIFAFNKQQKRMTESFDKIDANSINLRMLLIVNAFVLIFCIPYFISALKIIRVSGMSYLRHLVYIQSPEYISKTYISILFQWFIQPFLQFVLLVAASQIENIRRQKLLWFFAIINLFFEMIIFGGGRRTIITFMLEIIIFYLLQNKKRIVRNIRISKKKIGFIAIVSIIVYLIVSITASRLTKISVIESLYQYYVGPYIFFDKVIEAGHFNNAATQLGYGGYTFLFIITPISVLLSVLGISKYSNLSTTINANLNKEMFIGAHSIHNAHATSVIYFYSDFGKIFFPFGMVVFALILAYFTKNYKKDSRRFILGVYFANLAFYSAQTYPFTGVIQYVVMICTYIFISKRRSIK